MLTFISGIAALAAAQAAPANPHAQHIAQAGQMGQQGGGCCKKSADGKMECQMMKGHGSQQSAAGQHQGHSAN